MNVKDAVIVMVAGGLLAVFTLVLMPQSMRWYPYVFVDIGTGVGIFAVIVGFARIASRIDSVVDAAERIVHALARLSEAVHHNSEEQLRILKGNQEIARNVQTKVDKDNG